MQMLLGSTYTDMDQTGSSSANKGLAKKCSAGAISLQWHGAVVEEQCRLASNWVVHFSAAVKEQCRLTSNGVIRFRRR
jgi:hypothetical protein